jgi:ribonuclease G
MSKELVISANPHETRVAIMEEGQLCEFYVEREKEFALVGSIYKGRVTRVLPGMQSAFVEIGLDSDAFLYVSDFLEDLEEFDQVVTTVEDKVQKMEAQGGQVFAATNSTAPSLEPSDVDPVSIVSNDALAPESPAVPEVPPPPPSRSVPSSTAPSHDRSRPDHRRSEGRFGQRGGRGRHGRPGGRGGDRRYSRELPSSKYASPRPYENRPGDSGLADGHIPIILPGESLAKYRDKPVSAATLPPPVEDAAPSSAQPSSDLSARSISMPAPVESVSSMDTLPPAEFQSSSSTGLEPLPGETLSKWQTRDRSGVERSESPNPLPVHEEHREHEERDDHQFHEPEAVEEHHAAPDLSDDEATALAEHVAEAHIEEAVREEHESNLSSTEDAAEAPLSEAEEHAADEEEDREIAEEEAEAEGEGMIAPPPELDHEAEQAAEIEAATPSAENGSSIPAENPPIQGAQPSTARVRDDFRARMQHPSRRGGRDRGRRDDRGRRPQQGHGHFRPQPRRPQLIADMLKQGQEIIVQIAKEPLGKKGARITSHIALPGRFLVYMPTLDHTGVSRKIASAEDRSRLRHLVNEAKGASGGGFIVRTAAASASPDEVRADVEFLTRTWSEIKARSEQRKAPSLLHRDLNLVERILRDYMSPDYSAIWVDTEEEYTKVVEFMSRFQPDLVDRVKLYTKETPVFEEFGIQQEIDKGLRPKVWLKSGGYIVINHTEALVAIDVNTGKFVGKGSNRLEDTIVRTNVEAVKEIVRQMRLRDLGGIIIIDFIDMEERRNRERVMAALEDALRADRAPSKVLRFNEFGLVAITRKRTKQALERTLCQPCPYCTGSGMVKSIPTLCYEIQTEARKMAPDVGSGSLTLRVHPEIAKALKTRESSLIEELEQWTKKSIIIQADPTLHWEQYDIY